MGKGYYADMEEQVQHEDAILEQRFFKSMGQSWQTRKEITFTEITQGSGGAFIDLLQRFISAVNKYHTRKQVLIGILAFKSE